MNDFMFLSGALSRLPSATIHVEIMVFTTTPIFLLAVLFAHVANIFATVPAGIDFLGCVVFQAHASDYWSSGRRGKTNAPFFVIVIRCKRLDTCQSEVRGAKLEAETESIATPYPDFRQRRLWGVKNWTGCELTSLRVHNVCGERHWWFPPWLSHWCVFIGLCWGHCSVCLFRFCDCWKMWGFCGCGFKVSVRVTPFGRFSLFFHVSRNIYCYFGVFFHTLLRYS